MSDTNIRELFEPNVSAMKMHFETLFSDVPKNYEDGYIEISCLKYSEFFKVTELGKAINRAVELNKQGENVYTTPSVLKPNVIDNILARQQEDLKNNIKKSYRALSSDFYYSNVCWTDIDDLINDDDFKSKYAHAEPNYYVITSRKEEKVSTHLYWILDKPCTDKALLEKANKGILTALGGDKGTHNATRILKLGGVVAWPVKEGRAKQMTVNNFTKYMPPHNINDLIKAYPLPENKLLNPAQSLDYGKNILKQNNEWSIDDVINMLNHISPDYQYFDWLSVGMALHDYGVPFDVWDNWSSKGASYPSRAELYKKWNSFNKGGGTTIGTLYYYANQGGYHPSNYKEIAVSLPQKTEFVNPETGEVTESVIEIKETKKSKMFLISAADIKYKPISNDFVQGLLTKGSFSVVYGESNCGKTFFMTDLSFHVAEGKKWRNKRVDKGAIVYVALEGTSGLNGRVEAYKRETGETLKNFHIMPCPFDFLDAQGDVTEFINLIESEKEKIGDIKMIVIDTLARAMGGGDENSGQDMGILVKHADAIRDFTGAHICFVHHSGKDKAKGARGHSSLRAAVDTEIEISRNEGDDFSVVKVVKQRDLEKEEDTAFKLKSVEIGQNQYLETQTSCIVEFIEIDESQISKTTKLTNMQQFVYDAIIHAIMNFGKIRNINTYQLKSISYDEMREVLEERGFKEIKEMKNKTTAQQIKSATQTARVALQNKGKIGMDGEFIWLLNEDTSYNGKNN